MTLDSPPDDEESLRRALDEYRALLEAAPDAIVGVQADGQIALVNAQTERLFGYARTELIGQPVEVLVPDAARGAHPHHRRGYVADPRPRPMGAGMQLAGRRKDGTEFPAEISLSAIENADGVLVSAAIRDVTDRLEAQAERERLQAEAERERLASRLTQAERLESLGQLAGGVAHDFNNLLAVILNYASFVSGELKAVTAEDHGGRWDQVLADVEEIRRAAERATDLTHQLLTFGRREVVQPRVVDLNEVVAGVETILRRTLGEHVELVTDLRASAGPVVADPGQLEQVLMNLAVNARDAMPGGGTLTVTTDAQDLVAGAEPAGWLPGPDSLPGRFTRLRVADTGTGMPPEVLARAFEPFFTTKPRGEGSGLGLATVYGIISQAGGHLEVMSTPGEGTVCTVWLAVTDRPLPEPDGPPPRGEHRGGETILVVEDEDALREVTRRVLVGRGHTVLTAASGPEAIKVAAAHEDPLHLLLTDVVMPQMLGREVAQRLRAERPGLHVLFMSGYAESILTSQGTIPEGVRLLPKPFSADQLLAKVREVLDEGRTT